MSFTTMPTCPRCNFKMHISARGQYSCSNCGHRKDIPGSSSNSGTPAYDPWIMSQYDTTPSYDPTPSYDCSPSDFGGGCSFD